MPPKKKTAPESTLPVITEHDGKPIQAGTDTQPFHVVPLGRDLCVTSISTYKGKKSLDLRRYYEDENEEWRPTSKGIRIPAESVDLIMNPIFDLSDKIGAELAK